MNMLNRQGSIPLARWDPWNELEDLQQQMASFFGRSPGVMEKKDGDPAVGGWFPPVDIMEDDKEYLIKAELPEIKREDIKIMVKDGLLQMSGERKTEMEEKKRKYHRVERAFGSFTRAFTIPADANGEKVSAEFRDGVLSIHLLKDEKAGKKTVEVKVS